MGMQFKQLTRSEIPGGFSNATKDLIMTAMEQGGTARISTKGHCIIRNASGQQIALSRNTGNGYKRMGNAAADIKRLFPGAEVVEIEERIADTKMCSKCKHDKPREEFSVNNAAKDGLQPWCKECVSTANKESYQRRKETEAAATKHCIRCDTTKPREEFYKSTKAKDGLTTYCIACSKEASRQWHAKRKADKDAKRKSPVEIGKELAEAQRQRDGRSTVQDPAPAPLEAQPAAVVPPTEEKPSESVETPLLEQIKRMVAENAEVHALREANEVLRAENERLSGILRQIQEATSNG